MCGLAGACWTNDAKPLTDEELSRMTGVLAHRGPDGSGCREGRARNWPVALGHRRLSIIDLAGGAQPMSGGGGRLLVAFNGEIYNYRELRDRLKQRGHVFETDSDTEVIPAAYAEYGVECLQHFRGMFAFALWDGEQRRLLLARDRLGQKPLVYRLDGGRLIFASELKSLLQTDDAPRTLNLAALDAYLQYQYVPHPHCILEGYHKLPPAHVAVFHPDTGQFDVRRYWSINESAGEFRHADPPEATRPEHQNELSLRQELRGRLTEAVRLRLRSDVPLGAFLSGGIDSTIITALMQAELAEPVRTFSIGFPVAQFDERDFARLAAKRIGTSHHEHIVEPDALQMLPDLVWHYDEPFADSSAIPTMILSRLTRQDVTVALTGDGGDELFAGYDRYRAVELAARLDAVPRSLRKLLASAVAAFVPGSATYKSRRRRLRRFASALAATPDRRYLDWISIFQAGLRQTIYTDDVRQAVDSEQTAAFVCDAYQAASGLAPAARAAAADIATYLPGDILTKVDIASMSVGLECRSPFLDHEVAQLSAAIPIHMKRRGSSGKHVLKETFSAELPPEIVNRPKMGFGVPLDHWFRNELSPLIRDVLFSQTSRERGLFEPQAIRRLVEDHITGRADHSARLWALLMFELWQQAFLDGPSATSSRNDVAACLTVPG